MTGAGAPSAVAGGLKEALLALERHTWPTLSPDGRQIAFVRTLDAGPELWLRPAEGGERRLAVHHGEFVGDLRWTADSSTVVYRYTDRGRERWRLGGFRMGAPDPLDVAAGGAVSEFWLSRVDPGALLYSSSSQLLRARLDRPAQAPIVVAEDRLLHRWIVDQELRPRGGVRLGGDGSAHLLLGDDPATAREVFATGVDDTADLAVLGFSRDGRRLFILTSAGSPTRRLLAVDAATGEIVTLFGHPEYDISSYPIAGEGVWFDPLTGLPDICSVMDQRLRHHALSEPRRAVVRRLGATADASPVVIERSADDRTWLLVNVRDNAPLDYRLFDPGSGRSEEVLVNRPELAGHMLPKLEDFCFTASDGVRLRGYMMRPLHRRPSLPTVVLVHGGPNDRDSWRFHADAQYLAALGYLSLHVNYRGSRGFGRDFRLAGNGEWGGRMQEDLYDAVGHAIDAGLAAPGRIAFFGVSYGGYAALLAACRRPELVRCAVAISPPCDLVSFTRTPPRYWQPLAPALRRQVLLRRDGSLIDEGTLKQRSPTQVVDRRCRPLLVAHGVRDPRVPVADVDEFVTRARAHGVATRYLRFEDEGHLLQSNRNRSVLFSEIEAFLEDHLEQPEDPAALHTK